MLTLPATLNVRHPNPDVSIIDIQGEINSSSEHNLLHAYARAQRPGVRAVLLNFDKMLYMNSSGIGLLINLLILANHQGQRLAAASLSPHFQRIFDLTRLREAIPYYPNEGEALAALIEQIDPKGFPNL